MNLRTSAILREAAIFKAPELPNHPRVRAAEAQKERKVAWVGMVEGTHHADILR